MRFPIPLQTGSYAAPNAEVYYPVVYGLPDRAAQDRMNAAIRTLTHALIQEQQGGAWQPGAPSAEMTGLYEIKTNERGVLSLTMSNYAYTPPAAHGMTRLGSLTFDAATGASFTLSQLFRPGTDYAARIDAAVRAQIAERDIPLIAEFQGIAPEQPYYVADKALVVYFQLYELTPYVYGFPMFPISVYALQDAVVEDGPLGRMIPGA